MNLSRNGFLNLYLICSLIIFSNFCIVFNIPFLQQIFGIIFVLLLPGYFFLCIFGNKLNHVEYLFYSVGLSLICTLFIGYFLNNFSPLIGLSNSLEKIPLLLTYDVMILLFLIVILSKNVSIMNFSLNKKITSLGSFDLQSFMFVCLLLMLPVLSFLGTILLRTTGNGLINLFVLLLISVSLLILLFCPRLDRFAPIGLFVFSLSLLLMFSTMSNYLTGVDIQKEFYVFQITQQTGFWNFNNFVDNYNSCLSITLQPMVFTSLLNIPPLEIFRILYPALYSFVPAILFYLYRQYAGYFVSILSSFLLISFQCYYWIGGYARQEIAFVFFALFIYTLFNNNLNLLTKKLFSILFIVGITFSHYSTISITLILLFLSYSISYIMPIINKRYELNSERNVTFSFALLSFMIVFFWQVYVTSGSFDNVILLIQRTISNILSNGLDQEYSMELMMGKTTKPNLFKISQYVFNMLANIFIGFGLLFLWFKPEKYTFPKEYSLISFAAFVLIGQSVVSTIFSVGYNVERFYTQILFILSPFCIFGLINFLSYLNKHFQSNYTKPETKNKCLVIIYVLSLFSFNCGIISYFTEEPYYFVSSDSLSYKNLQVYENDYVAMEWLGNSSPRVVMTDRSFERLMCYGSRNNINQFVKSGNKTYLSSPKQKLITLDTKFVPKDTHVLLRYFNNIYGTIYIKDKRIKVFTEYPNLNLFNSTNAVYTNGGALVFYKN